VRQTEPKGLAHAVGFAKDFVGDQPFALYLGDAIYSKSLKSHADRFIESGCANLNLVQPVADPTRYGVANLDGDRIVKLVEKPKVPESNLAMAGLYFFRPQIWSVLPELQPSARGEYEITDAIQMLIDRDEVVLAGVYDGIWYDTGTLDSFLETSGFLIGRQTLVGDGAKIEGTMGHAVVIGEGANVKCETIEDSVVLAGANVTVSGPIRHCVIGGDIESNGALEGQILYGGSSN
jgi:glucose-1-phosphate thymidylyltransferase